MCLMMVHLMILKYYKYLIPLHGNISYLLVKINYGWMTVYDELWSSLGEGEGMILNSEPAGLTLF